MRNSPPFGLTEKEFRLLKSLNTPKKIQDFLERLQIVLGPAADTCKSPRQVLRDRTAHCMEGAMLSALALRLQGHDPLIVDLTSAPHDFDHVIAVYRQYGRWGAVSKSNYAVLRYRDPVYATLRELVMSFFHEYIDEKGKKTLRSYSRPVNLARFDRQGWMTSEEEVWYVPNHLVEIPHIPILTRAQIASLRIADQLERQAGSLVQWK